MSLSTSPGYFPLRSCSLAIRILNISRPRSLAGSGMPGVVRLTVRSVVFPAVPLHVVEEATGAPVAISVIGRSRKAGCPVQTLRWDERRNKLGQRRHLCYLQHHHALFVTL